MKKELTNIWIGEQDLTNSEEYIKGSQAEKSLLESITEENADAILPANRRDFLKILGFGLGAATVAAGCDIPVKKAMPYVIKPDSIVPGNANYYASSFIEGGEFASILVKTREGRPIKVDGNALAPNGYGATNARVQASVIGLYDVNRVKGPKAKSGKSFSDISWSDLDNAVKASLKSAKNIRVVSSSIISPTAKKALGEFQSKYPSAKSVFVDPVSYSAILDANLASFGDRVLPDYHFDAADIIMSFDCDFLGTWISPQRFAADYTKGRNITDVNAPKMSRHIQVESQMSVTGSNADNRVLVRPSEQGAAIAHVYNEIVGGGAPAEGLNEKAKSALSKLATQMKAAGSKSLVVCGGNNVAHQVLVNAINAKLGSYGTTLSFGNAVLTKQGNDTDVANLLREMESGTVDVVIINGANPVYTLANGSAFADALAKVKTKIAFGLNLDETNSNCDYIAATPHYLESWGDAQPTKGLVALCQPTIAPLFNTRQFEHSLLTWAESANLSATSDQPYYDYLKNNWQSTFYGSQKEFAGTQSFWDNSLHNGLFEIPTSASTPAFKANASAYFSGIAKPSDAKIEISFYEPINIGNGQYATNPWLMEMPNPVDRTSWGNYLAVPVNFDGFRNMVGFNDLKDGDLVKLTIDAKEYTVPVIQQFGQMPGTVAIALGYGRKVAGECGTNVGIDVNSHRTQTSAYAMNYSSNVKVSEKVGKEKEFSCVQYHHTYGVKSIDKDTGKKVNADESATVYFDYFTGVKGFQGSITERSIIYTANAKEVKEKAEHLHHLREHAQFLNSKQIYHGHDDLYATGHKWGMYVDLNACTGCGACTVACMAENNIPIVGKREVSRHHEMTWLRIDRYFYGELENPNTVYQPMMCQHCDNAPCENVCPVNATNHSSEGLNQMTYNRCIGTRSCANNCPYKVRRFNWLDYTAADLFGANEVSKMGETETPYGADNLTRMVLNPDVTVRSRGVIEKCSFCVQRIQESKLTAKKEQRPLRDGDIKTACQSSCPTGAITFGDVNNKESLVNKKKESPLSYIVLEEINVRSAVNYSMKVNNRDESLDA